MTGTSGMRRQYRPALRVQLLKRLPKISQQMTVWSFFRGLCDA
jgi:hypothetical protein